MGLILFVARVCSWIDCCKIPVKTVDSCRCRLNCSLLCLRVCAVVMQHAVDEDSLSSSVGLSNHHCTYADTAIIIVTVSHCLFVLPRPVPSFTVQRPRSACARVWVWLDSLMIPVEQLETRCG